MMELTRQEYLDRPVIQVFCGYLTGLFENEPFEHGFEVKWKRWTKYLLDPDHLRRHRWLVDQSEKTTKDGKKRKIIKLRFTSVKSAYEAYYWPTNSLVAATDDPTDEEEGEDSEASTSPVVAFDRESNERQLMQLRKSLTDALQESSAEKTFIAGMKILDWGQVYKGSVGWLIQKHENNELVQAIKDAVKVLDGDRLSDTTSFNSARKLRMDSGLTKVYSLASEHCIIYDDRVGAALGLMVTQFLKANPGHQSKAKKDKVPEELKFMRSATSSRNPSLSSEGFKFPGNKGGALHAQSNLMANWILHKIARELPKLWDKSDVTEKLRAMESALFMLGYRVA
jgi:hypothetical protein